MSNISKDSTADLVRIQELLSIGANVFNGGDPTAFFALVVGCPGCVWGAPNAMPKEFIELYNNVTAGKLKESKALWQRMFPANHFFWTHVYNAAIKAATNLSGRKLGHCHKPVQPLTRAEVGDLKQTVRSLGIE